MVPNPVSVGPEQKEMFWNHTPTYQEKFNFLLIVRIKVHWTHKLGLRQIVFQLQYNHQFVDY